MESDLYLMEQNIMTKSRSANTNKLHFLIKYSDKSYKIRAGCLVLRDFNGNCLMTKEPKLSKGREVIGFCGGTVEEHDNNIIDTVLRETYEECILSDDLPKDWISKWLNIRTSIIYKPTTLDEIIFNHIYTICKNRRLIYIDGHNAELKSMYFQVWLPKLYSDYLTSKYNLQVVSSQMFEVMSQLRDSQPVKYCLRFGVPSYNVKNLYFRLREIMIATPNFCKFLQYGMPKIDSEPLELNVLTIAKQSPWYELCKTGQRIIQNCPDDPIILDSCILITILMSHKEWQQIFDAWYALDKVDHGMSVINLVNHFLYGSLITPELESKRQALANLVL